MDESLQLSTQQRLQQRLLPQQVQFVRLLEMNGPEVEDAIRQAVDENPALEAIDDTVPANSDDFNETPEELQLADFSHDELPWYRLEAQNRSADDPYIIPQTPDTASTLLDALDAQLSELNLSDLDQQIARYIIGNIDDNGYVTRTPAEMATDLAIDGVVDDSERVKDVWRKVRTLDPAGVGAVDLRDTLLLQLRRKEAAQSVADAIEIVDDYFDLLSKKHYEKLRSLMGLTEARLRDALDEIRQLNPKPGSVVGGSDVEDRIKQIVPEFSVDVDGDKITVNLLTSISDLRIEPSFTIEGNTLDRNGSATESQRSEAHAFIKQKRDEATGFMRMVNMRQDTLLQVMRAIVTLQRDFFLTGDRLKLHPMVLKDIAAITGHDLSVISRATASKYVITPYGTFPLKFFFNERPKDDQPDITSHLIEEHIRNIIDREDKRHPLSDEAITAALNAQGHDIARRTVAKYRERMQIPVARLRRSL